MHGPGGMSQQPAECGLKGEQLKEEDRDPCASPPLKRLKQAHIPFKTTSPPSTNNGLSKSSKTLETPERVNNNQKISAFFEGKKDKVISGMVQAKPDSPDEKHVKFDSNMNNKTDTYSPQRTFHTMENGDVGTGAELTNLDNVTPVKTKLNTSTSSVESSPGCSNDGDGCVQITSVVTPTNSKPVSKMVKSSEKLKRDAERQAKKEERETLRLEKQKQKEKLDKEKQEAKLKKEQERIEAKRKKEQELQQKKDEKEKKEKERLEKKMMEDKEREDKNRAKLEEKNKKEEERKQLEEDQMRKKQKFKSYFKLVAAAPKQAAPTPKNTFEKRFKPFIVSKDMEMAPLCRRRKPDEQFRLSADKAMNRENFVSNYFEDAKKRARAQVKRRKEQRSTPQNDSDEIKIIAVKSNSPIAIDDSEEKNLQPKKTHKAKLFQFHLNTRPPYYGTWNKRSKTINPRNFLAMDKDLLDYEVDSDDEWEEEDPGESISHSEGEDEGEGEGGEGDENGEDDDEDEDGFFVPHGYLSDDEGLGAEEDKSGLEFDPEKKREQLLKKSRAWKAELLHKCKPMKPVIIGCSWSHTGTVDDRLLQYQMCNVVKSPIEVMRSVPKDSSAETNDTSTPARHPMAKYVPEEAMPELIKMLHGSTAGLVKLVKMFRKHWASKNQECVEGTENDNCSMSKRQLERKINEIAVKERRRSLCYKVRWYVYDKVLAQYGLENITIPEQTCASPIEDLNNVSRSVTPTPLAPSRLMPNIMQFTKVSSPTHVKSSEDDTSSPNAIVIPNAVVGQSNDSKLVNNMNPALSVHKNTENIVESMESETSFKDSTNG